jgi:hypothetical protein
MKFRNSISEKETIHKAFSHRNYGSKCVVLGYNSTYFSNKIQKGKTCYSEEQVISMLELLIDNIFVSFGGTLFQQVVGIPMGTNCAPLLADLFLYSYESEFLVSLTSSSEGYINGRNSANLELLIDKTSSIYLYVKLKALAS